MTSPTASLPPPRAAFCRVAALTIILILINLTWIPTGNPASVAATEAARGNREYLIKAAFVYELIKATRWPDQPSTRILLCVQGPDPFGSAWDSIRGRFVGARALDITRLNAAAPLSDCDVLFVGAAERQWWDQAHATLVQQPTLTLSEMVGFSQVGGMVTMMNVDNRLQFEVNLAAVRRAGLSINTDALELANVIHAGTASAY